MSPFEYHGDTVSILAIALDEVTGKPKSVPLQMHFHKLKQHDVSILLPFFTTHYVTI
jgi:hypothetical protein